MSLLLLSNNVNGSSFPHSCHFPRVYTSIPLASSIRSERYLDDHVEIIYQILGAAARAQEERRDSSLFLASPPNTTGEFTATTNLQNTRNLVDGHLSKTLQLGATSGSEFAPQ